MKGFGSLIHKCCFKGCTDGQRVGSSTRNQRVTGPSCQLHLRSWLSSIFLAIHTAPLPHKNKQPEKRHRRKCPQVISQTVKIVCWKSLGNSFRDLLQNRPKPSRNFGSQIFNLPSWKVGIFLEAYPEPSRKPFDRNLPETSGKVQKDTISRKAET